MPDLSIPMGSGGCPFLSGGRGVDWRGVQRGDGREWEERKEGKCSQNEEYKLNKERKNWGRNLTPDEKYVCEAIKFQSFKSNFVAMLLFLVFLPDNDNINENIGTLIAIYKIYTSINYDSIVPKIGKEK